MHFFKTIQRHWRESHFIKGSVIYVAGAVLLKGVGFILIPFYTSAFTTADYGTMELINTLMALLIIAVSFGFSQLIYIEFTHLSGAAKIDFVRRINYSFNLLALPILIVVGLILYFSQYLVFERNITAIIGLMIMCTYLSFFQNNIYGVLQLAQMPKRVTVNKGIVAVTLLVLNILFIKYLSIGILGVYLSSFIAIVLSLILFKTGSITGTYLGLTAVKKAEVFRNVKLGFPFIITSIAYFGINGVDRFIIKGILGEGDLGLYSLAFKFGSMLEPLLIAPVLSAYNPMIFKQFSAGDFNQKIFRNSLVILVVFFGIAYLLPLLARLIIDPKFFESLRLIPIFVMGFAFFFLSQMLAAPMLYLKRKRALVVNVVAASLVNLILNVALVNFYHLQGSALAFLITNVFWFLLTVYQAQRIHKDNKK